MPSFIIKGDCDDALAKLKTTLKAQDARFEATLQNQFKSTQPPPRKPAAMAPSLPQPRSGGVYMAPSGNSASATGSTSGSMLSSKRGDDDSVRGRLRTSLRSTQSR